MNRLDEDAYKVLAAKLGALVAIGSVSFICGILPYYSIKVFRSRFPTSTVQQITSAFICFSGGTLLGVTFLHLMPEVREKISRIQSEFHALSFPFDLPLSDIIAMSGFFGVYLLDELLHMCVESYSLRVKKRRETVRSSLHKQRMEKLCSQLPHEVSVFSLDNHENSKHQVSISRRSNHHASPIPSCVCQTSKPTAGDPSEEKELCSASRDLDVPEGRPSGERPSKVKVSSSRTLPQVSGLVTIAALSFHDIFEGIAIGVEPDLDSILFLYLSVASHKYAIAFCIGTDLVSAGSRLKTTMLSMMVFSLISPIGVIVGMIVIAENTANADYKIDSPTSVVMQGIAGGTLIYVVCFEVLQREGTDTHKKGIQNVAFVIGGFLVTLGFKILIGHSHSR